GDERGDVDDRPAAALEQVGNAKLAAQEHALEVDVLNALPRRFVRFENRRVVTGRDAGVVVEYVDSAVVLGHGGIHRLAARRVRDVDPMEERLAAVRGGVLALLVADIRDADARTLFRSEEHT